MGKITSSHSLMEICTQIKILRVEEKFYNGGNRGWFSWWSRTKRSEDIDCLAVFFMAVLEILWFNIINASMKLDDGIKMPFVAITLYKATVSTSKICNGKRLDLSQRERRWPRRSSFLKWLSGSSVLQFCTSVQSLLTHVIFNDLNSRIRFSKLDWL